MSTDDGKVVGDLPIAAGVDATRWDGNQAFASTAKANSALPRRRGASGRQCRR